MTRKVIKVRFIALILLTYYGMMVMENFARYLYMCRLNFLRLTLLQKVVIRKLESMQTCDICWSFATDDKSGLSICWYSFFPF